MGKADVEKVTGLRKLAYPSGQVMGALVRMKILTCHDTLASKNMTTTCRPMCSIKLDKATSQLRKEKYLVSNDQDKVMNTTEGKCHISKPFERAQGKSLNGMTSAGLPWTQRRMLEGWSRELNCNQNLVSARGVEGDSLALVYICPLFFHLSNVDCPHPVFVLSDRKRLISCWLAGY